MIPRTIVLALFACSLANAVFAEPPLPPEGMRWVLNHELSDEFNGTQLDETKWIDHHPTWKGRVPGIFLPSQVSVRDGHLRIRGEKLDQEIVVKRGRGKEDVYTIAGGAVVSRHSAFLGYYECRCKAAATTMSTTFWFSGGGGIGPNGCDSYGQEWDVQECIGRQGDFSGKYFANGMHSNAHYWYTDCDGEKFDHRAEQVRFEDDELASADFHVYGGWWRDATRASYYYDNGEPKEQTFYNEISETPFDTPMRMNLVSETYPFPWIELPTDEELADPEKSVAIYDWVRAYKLVDIDSPEIMQTNPNKLPNGGFEAGDLSFWKGRNGWRDIVSDPEHVDSGKFALRMRGRTELSRRVILKPETMYEFSCSGKVSDGSRMRCDIDRGKLFSAAFKEAKYTHASGQFRTPRSGVVTIRVTGGGSQSVCYLDDFVVREVEPQPVTPSTVVDAFEERIALPGDAVVDVQAGVVRVPLVYASNQDRSIRLTLRRDEVVLKEVTWNGLAGYGNGVVEIGAGEIGAGDSAEAFGDLVVEAKFEGADDDSSVSCGVATGE
ncbi:hydrolase [Rhodopirellula sallentina]|nr:hydrolase [Rhodopirellula sallentina]